MQRNSLKKMLKINMRLISYHLRNKQNHKRRTRLSNSTPSKICKLNPQLKRPANNKLTKVFSIPQSQRLRPNLLKSSPKRTQKSNQMNKQKRAKESQKKNSEKFQILQPIHKWLKSRNLKILNKVSCQATSQDFLECTEIGMNSNFR